MTLTEIVDWLRAKEEQAAADSKQFLEEHLPVISSLAEKAASNPVVDAVMNAAHLSPEWLAALADVITGADAALGVAADAKAEAEAQLAAAQAPAEAEAEPPPAG